ncbi:VOC family protein [Rhizobium puerariae]|uniref:VOC family protein n=1 Tax=Rhizobium puerariae TaxID=1585791 RepID=A0ABV6AIP2_9HYPH
MEIFLSHQGLWLEILFFEDSHHHILIDAGASQANITRREELGSRLVAGCEPGARRNSIPVIQQFKVWMHRERDASTIWRNVALFSGLDHIDIAVENFSETVTFLTELGFEIIRDNGNRGTVEIRFPGGADQPFIELRPCVDKQGNRTPAGLRHLALRAQDFEKTYSELKEKGFEFRGVPRLVESSGRTVVSINDPNGSQLQIVSAETD